MGTKKKKILFLSLSQSWGGLEMNLVRYAGWMKARGHDVSILCCENSSMHKHAMEMGLNCIPHTLEKSSYLGAAQKLKPVIRKIAPDVLWFREKEIQKMLPFLKSASRKMETLYQQGMQLGKPKKDLIHRWLYSYVDHWLAPNRFMYEQAKAYTTLKDSQLHLLPLAMDIAEFTSLKKEKKKARIELELPPDKTLIGVIGRIDPQKNQLIVLEAFKKLHHQHQDAELLIMGDNTFDEGSDYENELRAFAENAGIADKVHFRPYRKEVELFYSAIDIMVMPSLNESFGRVTLEGMTYGLPIIGANTGGTAELIGDEEMLFAPKDADHCSALLNNLLGNTELRESHGSKMEGQSKVYSHKSILERIEKLLL